MVLAAAGSLNHFAADGSFMEQFTAGQRDGGGGASGSSDSDRQAPHFHRSHAQSHLCLICDELYIGVKNGWVLPGTGKTRGEGCEGIPCGGSARVFMDIQ